MLMKIKEVIVLAYLSRTTITPLLLTYENKSMYLHVDPQGCALFGVESPEPSYRVQEPLLLAHGIMTDAKTVHLVVLKTSGELCYTLISGSSTPQTTLIAKLDVRATRYRRLFLFPQGKIIHIFYASTHQAIPNVWHIEHRLWNGVSWLSTRMGEVVHPREPLYHVNLDSQGNLHFLTITFQGRHSLLFTNRFNGTFNIWGSPTETLKISGEVVDIAALMTSDNVHHLYWVTKAPNGRFELRTAQQIDAHELSSSWHPSHAPIKTFNSPWKSMGALEINGVLWLLARTGEEVLMLNDGKGWKFVSSHPTFHQPLQWVHKGKRNFHQTYWLEDQVERHSPAYHHELGFTLKNQSAPLPQPFQPVPTQTIPPVPAFYPELLSPNSDPLPPIVVNISPTNQTNIPVPISEEISSPQLTIDATIEGLEVSEVSENPTEEVLLPQPLQENIELERLVSTVAHLEEENAELQRLVSTVSHLEEENAELQRLVSTVSHLEEENAELQRLVSTVSHLEEENAELQRLVSTVSHLEEENANMSLVLHNTLSKFDQILETISENAFQAKQEVALPIAEIPFDELEPVKEAMSNLEKETESLSQVLRVMLVKQEESDSSLEKLETQLSQLQTEKEVVKNKGGFWNKWIT